ncbi:MAG: type II toxin-antitoxin system HicB family antitoxin [Ruminococcaceae bacterium]|nr:type II toxin-antitoxin system HicB family antitoxin [Oscillospiraceae bacterium]
MKNVLRYKGYSARPEYSAEDKIFYGKILGIDDLIDFYSDSAKEIENEFHAAVDDYLAFCEEVGKQPQKEFSGTFNVRVSPELHRRAAQKAQEESVPLNRVVESALEEYLEPIQPKTSIMVLPPEMVKQFTQPVQTVKSSDKNAAYYTAGEWSSYLYEGGKVKVC